MNVYKVLGKVPINCRICENFLDDKDFLEEYKTQYVCGFNEKIDPVLTGVGCEEFKIGKWALVEFLEAKHP